MPSTSPETGGECHSYFPSSIQCGNRNLHRRMISSESTGSEQVSTNMSLKERPLNYQSQLIEEQAEVISKLSERLTKMEHKN